MSTIKQTAAAVPFLMLPKTAVDTRNAIRNSSSGPQNDADAATPPRPRGTTFEQRIHQAADHIENQVEFPNGKGGLIIPGPATFPSHRGTNSLPPHPTTPSPSAPQYAKQQGVYAELGREWLDLARDEETAILGETPSETDFPTIIKKLADSSAEHISVEEHKLPNGQTWGYTLTDPSGHIDLSLLDGKHAEENSEYAGEFSTPIYQAIFAWAHNNGRTITEDVVLSHLAVLRRTSHMFSSALRFGTTRHMLPGPNSGIEGWRTDDTSEATQHNIGLLAAREAELVRERLPQLQDLRYDPASEAFYEGDTRIPSEGIQDYLLTRIAALDPNFAQGVGNRTLRRALATLAAQEAIESGQPVRLVGNAAKAPAALKEVRYSQSSLTSGTPAHPKEASKLDAIRASLLGEPPRATSQRAVDWMRMFKAIAPGAARELDLQVLNRYEASRRMAAIEASLTGRSVVYGVPQNAHAAIHRDTIYLFQEALGQYRRNGNELTQAVRRAQHEVCHKWWEALSQKERDALTRLWNVETTNRTGPLYGGDGHLRPEVMAGVETDVQEWFAERAALANDAWAQKRASIADHDGSYIGRAAASLRGWLFDARQTIAPSLSRDVIADELRNVLRRGTGYRTASHPAFARVGQTLRAAERTMVEDKPTAPLLDTRQNNEAILRQAAALVKAWPDAVVAADGTGVDLRVADGGSIGSRVYHLLREQTTSRLDFSKAPWIDRIPETLMNAQVRLVDVREGTRIYIRKYIGGVNHAVVVRPDGRVESQKAFSGHLETQFPIADVNDPRSRQKHMIADWVRRDIEDQ